ncbi:MAG: hypothetical protein Q9223_007624, partial [Gallowayella weberi]
MEEVDHHASTVHHQPLLPAFTPINRALQSPAHIDTVHAPIPAQLANKGKKRQRDLSAPSPATPKPAKTTRSRLPRKAKQANQALAVPQGNDHVSSLGDIQEAGHQTSKSNATLLPDEPVCESSLQTGPQRPSPGGLEFSYQAAFEQAQQQLGIDGRLGLLQPNHVDHDKKISGSSDMSFFHSTSLSHNPPSKQPEPIEETSSDLLGVETVADGTVLGSTCRVPCSSGIIFPVPGLEALTPRPAIVSRTLPHGEKYLPQPELDDWDMMIPQTNELSAVPAEAQSIDNIENGHDGTTLGLNQTDAVDSPYLDDLFCTEVEDECLSKDFPNKSGQILMSESNEHDLVPATSRGSLVDSDTLSYSSSTDILLSRADDNNICLSSSQPLLESSSPCHQFHTDQQPVSDKGPLSKRFTPDKQATDDDLYDDEEVEKSFLDFQSPTSAQVPPPSPPESPNQEKASKPEWMTPHPITPDASPVKIVAPWTLQNPSLTSTAALAKKIPMNRDIPHLVSFDQKGAAIPFIRPPFPNAIRDRSPVLGLNSDTLLRTCFRIGEALNAGSSALRTRIDAVIELYARVTFSERPPGSVKQHFHFADIFSPDKPPFLKGTYGVWKGCDLWDLDSKVFLGEEGKGKMARVVGRIGREEKTRGLEMMVLSVWEADWED